MCSKKGGSPACVTTPTDERETVRRQGGKAIASDEPSPGVLGHLLFLFVQGKKRTTVTGGLSAKERENTWGREGIVLPSGKKKLESKK